MRTLTDQEHARREKLRRLRTSGIDPYPARIGVVQSIQELQDRFDDLQRGGKEFRIAGRVRALRLQGGSLFLDLDDGSAKLQCFCAADDLGDAYQRLVETVDLGDFLMVAGSLFTTKRGEKTIKSSTVSTIAKALRPLPDKRHGLIDVELRYRHRELDLIANPEARKIFMTRHTVIKAIREFLDDERFLEVETPILQSIPGGANARPFMTHHNALSTEFFLRVAPELFLKRLIVGGLPRVFEIARCFRNEGIDNAHNPEFTQVECYAAYMDYNGMMELTEQLVRHVVTAVHGKPVCTFAGATLTFEKSFPRLTFHDALAQYASLDIDDYPDTASLTKKVSSLKLDLPQYAHRGKILDEIFKTFVRPKIAQPTFIINHPIELSPLAKKLAEDPRYTERFQLLVGGSELCNAFSELNDPDDQRERFIEQERLRKAGDDEAQRIDEDFLTALEYGMPPTAGLGMGIDRLTMLMTDQQSIKEVIAFPTLRPKP